MTTRTTKSSKTRARTLARTVGTAAAQRAVRMTGKCPKCGCTFVVDHSDKMSGPAKRTRAQWRTALAATRTPKPPQQPRRIGAVFPTMLHQRVHWVRGARVMTGYVRRLTGDPFKPAGVLSNGILYHPHLEAYCRENYDPLASDKPANAFDAAEQAQWDALKYGGAFHESSIPPGVYVAGSRMGPDEYGTAKPRKRRSK